jgi:hypothetical protein
MPDDLPPDLARLLTRMTALTPRRRPTALQCAKALRNAELEPVQEFKSRRGILIATAAVALGLAAGAWTLLANQGPTTGTPTNLEATASSARPQANSPLDPTTTLGSPQNLTPGAQNSTNPASDNSAQPQSPGASGSATPTTDTTAPVTTVTSTEPESVPTKDKEPPGQVKKSTTTTKKDH